MKYNIWEIGCIAVAHPTVIQNIQTNMERIILISALQELQSSSVFLFDIESWRYLM